jgi:5-amino-6-(5-phosphoribosylamino)uracil reductase
VTRLPGPRPYVVLRCAMSADGYVHDKSDQRLLLSNDADFRRVDAERSLAPSGVLLPLRF